MDKQERKNGKRKRTSSNEAQVRKNLPVKTKNKTRKIGKIETLAIIFSFIILLLIVMFATLYLTLNIYLYVNAKANNNEITFTSYFRYLLIDKIVVDELKEKEKSVNIIYNNSTYTIPVLQKVLDIELNINEHAKFENEIIKDIECLYIRNGHYNLVKLKLPDYLACKNKLDIYTLNNDDTITEYKKGAIVNQDGTINIEKKEESKGYIVIYVPLLDVIVNDSVDVIGLSKGEETKLNLKFVPSNATNTEIRYIAYENSKINVNDLVLTGNEIGDEKLTLESIYDNVKFDINFHIANYVKDIQFNVETLNLIVGNSYTLKYTIIPEDAENPNLSFSTNDENIATINDLVIRGINPGSCTVTASTTEGALFSKSITVNVKEKPTVTTENGGGASGLTYIQGILIANKTYALPADYNPGVNAEAMAAFNKMKAAAQNEGIALWIASGFRSYATQQGLYARYVSTYGKEAADTFSARAGHSEHQTGLAFDLNYIEDWFGDTKEGKWLAANSYKYGFIIRYPKSKEQITGYKYEPWHVRYLGESVATAVYNSGLCLEEYLGINSVYSY